MSGRFATEAEPPEISINRPPEEPGAQTISIRDLLEPLPLERFLDEFWGKKPVHVRGKADKFRNVFSYERLEQSLNMAARSPLKQRILVRASFDRGKTQIRVDPGEAIKAYRSGGAICAEALWVADPHLRELATSLRRQIGFVGPADCRVYLSPDHEGFACHFDARIATTLQIEGKKRWRFSNETALEWPHYQINPAQNGTTDRPLADWENYRPAAACSFEEVELEPGDVLSLPAGVWHSAEAIGHSLAINVAMGAPGSTWAILLPSLMRAVATNPDWRRPAPAVAVDCLQAGELPHAVELFVRTRIDELIDALHGLKNDKRALYGAWNGFQCNKIEAIAEMARGWIAP